eukprot:TRINITY_DN33643_c0_g1_i1.p1 TRINITY_DN33643_c0_g1~~TRINITY_DN33643_c0_g1_i1.p1  ORF type:complete len:350 (+),score=70.87 TRINITY_DN33643_c0_g1_i1:27-1076(+)
MLRKWMLSKGIRCVSRIPGKTQVDPQGSNDASITIEEDPRLKRRNSCAGSKPFDGMGEAESMWETDPAILPHWHKNIGFVPEIRLRMNDNGTLFFEDRPHAQTLQLPQVEKYFSLLRSHTTYFTATAPTIIDAGANIGVFATHAKSLNPDAQIYCIEPIPSSCAVLHANLERFDQSTRPKVINCGLGDRPDFKPFKILRGSSQSATCQEKKWSLSAADAAAALQKDPAAAMIVQSSDDFLHKAYNSQVAEEVVVEVRTLSSVVQSHSISSIDLLKIDAEASELAILQGVEDEHFLLIKNIILEVHTRQRVDEITQMLSSKGFNKITTVPLEETVGCSVELFLMCATRDA